MSDHVTIHFRRSPTTEDINTLVIYLALVLVPMPTPGVESRGDAEPIVDKMETMDFRASWWLKSNGNYALGTTNDFWFGPAPTPDNPDAWRVSSRYRKLDYLPSLLVAQFGYLIADPKGADRCP